MRLNVATSILTLFFGLCVGATGLSQEETPPSEKTAEAPRYTLRYHFEPGQFVHYRVSDTSTVVTRKNQVSGTIVNQSDVSRHYRVVTVNDAGGATLELMIDHVRLQAQFDNAPPTIFDSANKEQQPDKFRGILQSVGQPSCRMEVSGRGELLSLHSLTTVKAPEADPAVNFLVVFPEEPVAIGDTWKQTLEIEVPVTSRLKEKVKLLRQYTLSEVKDQQATISMHTILVTTVRDPAIQTRLLQQTPHGTILFDLEKQLILERKLESEDQVIGAYGTGTLVESRATRVEKLIADPAQVARAEAATETPRP